MSVCFQDKCLYLFLKFIFLHLDRVYTEELPGDAGIMLFIKDLKNADAGNYTCSGIYANNEEMTASVEIITFSKC